MRKKIALFYVMLTSLCFLAFAFCLLYSFGFRLNLSESLPGYIYRVTQLEEREMIERGDCALIDLSRFDNSVIELGIRRGYVSRSQKMLKEIGAIPGDTVVLSGDLLYVNGVTAPMVISSEDSRGKALFPYPTPVILSRDHYWLVSIPYRGFDSRYFGPVRRDAFTHRAVSLFF
jgi:conjugative transfer signal peptidase TraF